ncbi:MAG: alpha/beta fold hydrolase [Arenicellales bacterium]
MIYRFNDYRLDSDAFEIRRGSERLEVEPQVLQLLILLVENRGRIVSREQVFAEIWKDRVVSDAALSSRIKSARRLLGDDGVRQRFIRTVYGRGFRFVAEVSTQQESSSGGEQSTRDVSLTTPRTRYAKSGELHIAYQVFGDGPLNMVVAPGFISHIENYWDDPHCAAFWLRLGEIARVALFDKRGTGLSDQVPHLPHMDERMDDVRAVMDAAGFERAVIMGISEGGSLASLFAAHHPERCEGLILYGAFARFTSWFPTPESLEELFDYIRSDWGSGNSLPAFAPSMGDDYREWWGKFERLGANPGAAIALMRMNSEIDISGILHAIRTSTLVIHRSEDVLIDPEAGNLLAENIPGARLVSLPGRDHLAWTGGNSEAITDAIREFVSEIVPVEASNTVLGTIVAIGTKEPDFRSADETKLRALAARFRGTGPTPCDAGFLISFDRPAQALHCARAIASGIGRAQVGVHTGEVELSQDNIEGPAATLAAQIAALAPVCEVLVSRTVTDLVAGSGISLEVAADKRLANMPPDWKLYRLSP